MPQPPSEPSPPREDMVSSRGGVPGEGSSAAAAPSQDLAVQTHGLTKRFGAQLAVDGIDLEVPRGAVYGFLGPNGSGKTTTIRILLGLVQPTAGQHWLLGRSMPQGVGKVLHRVGALIEGPAFHPYLTGRANLERLDALSATSSPRDRARRVMSALERVGLSAAAGKKYRAYSLGMGQRLGIAAALLSPRDLLVLDEPTNGLDPRGTREIRHLIGGLADDGATVLVSSHLLSEVEQVCTHLGVMNVGRMVAQGPIEQLRSGGVARVRVDTDRPQDAARVLGELGLADVSIERGSAYGELGLIERAKIVPALVEADVPVLGFAVTRPSLEDLFVSLTGEGFDVNG